MPSSAKCQQAVDASINDTFCFIFFFRSPQKARLKISHVLLIILQLFLRIFFV